MVQALAKGDEVVTNGGLLGRISKVGDNFIELDVTEGVTVKEIEQVIALAAGTIGLPAAVACWSWVASALDKD